MKYVINPKRDVPTSVLSSVQINLLSYKKFEQSYKKDRVAYALVVVGKNEEPTIEVPIEV